MTRRPALDVSELPHVALGHRDPLWWGVVGLMAIESTVFATRLAYLADGDMLTISIFLLSKRALAAKMGRKFTVASPAVALAMAADGATVDHVVAKGLDGQLHRLRAPDIVLANGTIEIARLLSLSLADHRPPPWSENPWLGRGFLEHIDASAGAVKLLDRKRFHALFDAAFVDGLRYKPKLKLGEAAQRRDRDRGARRRCSHRTAHSADP